MKLDKELYDIWSGIVAHQGDKNAFHYRLMKIGEENGEAIQAYISYMGANKRKSRVQNTRHDVARELCDVAITALVALHDWVGDPMDFFEVHLMKIADRVKEQGS